MSVKWKIIELERHTSHNDRENVVSVVHWEATAVEVVNEKVFSGRVYGATSLNISALEQFTQYNDLTEQQVMQWVFDSGEDKDVLENMVLEQIEEQKIKASSTNQYPWTGQRVIEEQ